MITISNVKQILVNFWSDFGQILALGLSIYIGIHGQCMHIPGLSGPQVELSTWNKIIRKATAWNLRYLQPFEVGEDWLKNSPQFYRWCNSDITKLTRLEMQYVKIARSVKLT